MTKLIRIKCPNLGCCRILAIPSTARGKLVRCRQCGTVIRIPQVQQAPVEAEVDGRPDEEEAA
ncbi:MAG: hypothetical protein KC983_07285 [Phycisphaerales bacterium]|nr:hypothetical protein [Phycisphaerales bacterium]